ncbi:hypothetical protein FRUB_01029 [Fimbriiglobus ruber]|uniref:Uncharacterized protein n=1 Tax=Fimbriiglobus ruber TaxID=1908690 RepID=A0A225E0S8_9BACT|nr:hypothetical protein FRUB_01029 [Fimbriiglobus ruber]
MCVIKVQEAEEDVDGKRVFIDDEQVYERSLNGIANKTARGKFDMVNPWGMCVDIVATNVWKQELLSYNQQNPIKKARRPTKENSERIESTATLFVQMEDMNILRGLRLESQSEQRQWTEPFKALKSEFMKKNKKLRSQIFEIATDHILNHKTRSGAFKAISERAVLRGEGDKSKVVAIAPSPPSSPQPFSKRTYRQIRRLYFQALDGVIQVLLQHGIHVPPSVLNPKKGRVRETKRKDQ